MNEDKLKEIRTVVDSIGFSELDNKVPSKEQCFQALIEIDRILEDKPTTKGIPYIGFSNDTLKDAEEVKAGNKVSCPKCGELVLVKESDPPMLQCITHCSKSWLVGIKGKCIMNKRPDASGNI